MMSYEDFSFTEMQPHRFSIAPAFRNLTRTIAPDSENFTRKEAEPLVLVYPTHDYTVVVYAVILLFGIASNLYFFIRFLRSAKSYQTKARLRFFHVVSANLLVCVLAIPFEIGWRMTIEWKGGNVGCKVLQFFRVLGLYALANTLTAAAVDKLLDVRMLMRMGSGVPGGSSTKRLFVTAWTLSVFCSLPQVIIFRQNYSDIHGGVAQCEADVSPFLGHEHVYNMFMLSFMFLIPSLAMLVCYGIVFHHVKSTKELPEDLEHFGLVCSTKEADFEPQLRPRVYSAGNQSRTSAGAWSNAALSVSSMDRACMDRNSTVHVRSFDGSFIILDETFDRDLRIFFTITLVFIVTTLPYVCFALWYMIDDQSHGLIHPILQELPFVLVLTNVLLIPAVHWLRLCISP